MKVDALRYAKIAKTTFSKICKNHLKIDSWFDGSTQENAKSSISGASTAKEPGSPGSFKANTVFKAVLFFDLQQNNRVIEVR